MKKIISIISAVLLIASASVFTACTQEEDVSAPTETWVQKDYTYKTETGVSQLTCYFMFTEKGYTNSKLLNTPEDSRLNTSSATTIKPGLTVVVVPAASSTGAVTGTIAAELSSNKFICKTFPLKAQAIADDGTEATDGYSFEMSSAKWNVFYYANIASFMKNDQLKNPPVPLSSASYKTVTDLKDFSWKKLLANYLLGTL